jgi:hypothetical protein
MKKTSILALALLAASALGIATAHAGLKGNYPLTVDLAKRTAKGSIGSTRNATNNTNAYLGVIFSQVAGVGNFIPESVTLEFRTSGGNSTFIDVQDANLQKIAHSILSDSYVSFTWDANFVCQGLTVENSSDSPPSAL